MFNLAIPHLQVDPLSKSLSANGGEVQTRINGIIASQAEVAALLPKDIVRIEMIENPGERYGNNSLGAVVDIIVRKREQGGLINIQTSNSPNVPFGENNITAKYNRGKSQWGVNYNLVYNQFKKRRTNKSETYNLGDKIIHREQVGINDRRSYSVQDIDLSYNLSEPGKYVLTQYSETTLTIRRTKTIQTNCLMLRMLINIHYPKFVPIVTAILLHWIYTSNAFYLKNKH